YLHTTQKGNVYLRFSLTGVWQSGPEQHSGAGFIRLLRAYAHGGQDTEKSAASQGEGGAESARCPAIGPQRADAAYGLYEWSDSDHHGLRHPDRLYQPDARGRRPLPDAANQTHDGNK